MSRDAFRHLVVTGRCGGHVEDLTTALPGALVGPGTLPAARSASNEGDVSAHGRVVLLAENRIAVFRPSLGKGALIASIRQPRSVA